MQCRSCGKFKEMTNMKDPYTLVSHPRITKGQAVWLCSQCCEDIAVLKIKPFVDIQGIIK